MNEYQINIHYTSDDDLLIISTALSEARIDNRADNNSVFVEPSQVGAAVAVINGLGFETDEDETEDIEDYNPDFN